jgi:hypothetical protein
MSGGTGGQVNGPYGRYTASATDPNQAVRGGSGGFMNQFISPGAAGMGPNQYGTGMMNGGPQANYNGMSIGNKIPFKGGTTEKQMNDNVRAYWAWKNAQGRTDTPGINNGAPGFADVYGNDGQWHTGADKQEYDPRRSPDVAAPWRIDQPYKGPVTGGTPMPPNPTGAASWSSPRYGTGGTNMYAGGNPNFNEAAPGYNGLLGRASYR